MVIVLALCVGPASEASSSVGQAPAAADDARLMKLPASLRDQGRLILSEPDEDKRADLVELLAEKDAVGALDFLLALLESDPSADVRENIVDELEEVDDPRVDPALRRRVLVDADSTLPWRRSTCCGPARRRRSCDCSSSASRRSGKAVRGKP